MPSSSTSLVCSTYTPPYNVRQSSAYSNNGAAEFGWSVATSCDGRYVLIGAANDPSAVYLYRNSYEEQSENTNTTTTTTTSSTTHPRQSMLYKTFHNPQKDKIHQTQFGLTVAMNVNGQRILIGDPGLEIVYLYDDRGHLLHTFKLSNDDYLFLESMYGSSLSINDDGTMVVIGAQEAYYIDDILEIQAAGAVYVYEYMNGEWNQVINSPLYKPTVDQHNKWPQNNDKFGVSVKLSSDGSKLVVGALNVNDEHGAVYLYEITKMNGITNKSDESYSTTEFEVDYVHTFVSPQFHNNNHDDDVPNKNHPLSKWFGWAVDMTDQYLYVGSAGESIDQKENAGAVFVFSLHDEDNSYPYVSTILSPIPTADARFGAAISVTGNRLLIASYGDGTAYWYDRVSSIIPEQDDNKNEEHGNNNNNFYVFLKQKIPVPTLAATTSTARFYGASVALSRNGEVGIVGVPRALGKSGFMTTGTAFGLCLPPPPKLYSDDDVLRVNYTCPNLELPSVSWKSSAFWFSWDSMSGKLLALAATIALCLFILFYGNKRSDQSGRRRNNQRFELLPNSPSDDYDIELRVIQEETAML